MDIHQATTPRNSTEATVTIRRWRDSRTAQIANAAKASASAMRSQGHGRFE
jgi:hypothetical protein